MLGPVTAHVAARPVDLPEKQRAILALLALECNRVVPIDSVIDGVWGELAPRTVRNALQVHISGLRRVLGADGALIETRPSGYRLAVEAAQVDVQRFRGLVAEARRGASPAGPALRGALALWRGPALDDLGHLPFAEPIRVALDEERLTALERRLDADLAEGQAGELVAELEVLVNQHPFREGLWYRLVLALYRCERTADALAVCARVKRLFREDLGLEPGPRLRDVEAAVLRADPSLDAPARTRTVALPGAPSTKLIGRERALSDLVAAVRTNRLVTVVGPGGAGKTRVALETAHLLTHEFDRAVLVDLTAITEADAVAIEIAALLALDVSDRNLWDAVAAALTTLRTLLIIDNAEHLAPGIAANIQDIVRRATASHVLVTSRTPLRCADEHVQTLEPLGPEAARELFFARARAVNPRFVADAGVVDEVCRRLDALPLALEVVAARCRLLTGPDLLRHLTDILQAPARDAADPAGRHGSVHNSVLWSSSLLTDSAKGLLAEICAFVTPAPVRAISDMHGANCLDLLDELADANLIVVEDGRIRALEIVREVIRSGATAAEWEEIRARHARWARRAADAVNAAVGTPPTERARALESMLPDGLSAMQYLLEANENELAGRLLIALAPGWRTTRSKPRLEQSLQWLADVARRPGITPETLVRILLERQHRLFFLGQPAASLTDVRAAARLARTIGDDWGIARANHAMAWRAMLDGDHALAQQLCGEGQAAAIRAGDVDLTASFENVLGCNAIDEGEFTTATQHLRAYVLATIDRDPAAAMTGLMNLVDCALVSGRLDEARAALAELWSTRSSSPVEMGGVTLLASGLVEAALDHPRRAAALLADAISERLTFDDVIGSAADLIGVAAAAQQLGDTATSARMLVTIDDLRMVEPSADSEFLFTAGLEHRLRECVPIERSATGYHAPVTREWRSIVAFAGAMARALVRS